MRLKLFFTKLRNWEYWPFEVVYFPLLFYWLILAARARSFFYFTAANPGIETGGMLGESKYSILKKIPVEFTPKTIYFSSGTSFENICNQISNNGISYPLIVKPDVGERGTKVEKIVSEDQLRKYVLNSKVDFLIQEFIDFPLEFGIFFYRYPEEASGEISSIVRKEFLKVCGDGVSAISKLIERYPRAAFQLQRFLVEKKELLNYVPANGETVELEPIGNHCRGTMFLNANDLIDDRLTEAINAISKNIEGFYYGRYDLKCKSVEDLKAGKNIKIMELNGVGAEPAHIYQPGFSIWEAYKVLFSHWRVMSEISQKNRELGHTYMTLREGLKKYRWIRQHYKKLKA